MSPSGLDQLRAEVRELAARLGEAGPDHDAEGYKISLSATGLEYVLSYTERGVTDVVLQSSDENEIKERYFLDLTFSKAAFEMANRYPPVGPWSFLIDWLVQPSSIRWQRECQILQEAMLESLDPRWSERAAVSNALRLREQIDIVFGVRGHSTSVT